ncbi:Mitochondrial ribosome-associated GTPase 2 [Lamellibrachia satsuma]|nr:Mitochondrial ribosome-associated GTPase 2 [Lamellibrachia satsuma]
MVTRWTMHVVRVLLSRSTVRQCSAPPAWLILARGQATALPVRVKKARSEKQLARKFVDFKRVRVIGGQGGDGCLSFLRLPFNEWAGPDGGDGGNGGHVIFQASHSVKSLEHVTSQCTGESGANGRNKHRHGKNAPHTYIQVPLGTFFKDANEDIVADLKKDGDLFVAARGGAGGHGNHYFLTNEERAPTVYEEGARGQEQLLFSEMRVMAHVGLVGFPNAGKSTLLRAISRARPKVASYPFTTLNPHVGIVTFDDHEQLAVADIPGLISGAHLNRGLGFSFLRHIDRCLLLLYVLDLSDDAPWRQLDELRYELEQYEPGLSSRPHAIVANKTDLPMAAENLKRLREHIDLPVLAISAKYESDIEPLLLHLKVMYEEHATDSEHS